MTLLLSLLLFAANPIHNHPYAYVRCKLMGEMAWEAQLRHNLGEPEQAVVLTLDSYLMQKQLSKEFIHYTNKYIIHEIYRSKEKHDPDMQAVRYFNICAQVALKMAPA